MAIAIRPRPKDLCRFLVLAVLPLLIAPCSSDRLFAETAALSAAQAAPDALTKARAYCRRLQFASLDFICLEEIAETITGGGPPPQPIGNIALDSYQTKTQTVRHELVYDYQYIRKGSLTTEKRTLLREDGVAKNVPDSDLGTWSFRFANVLFGPATILDERNIGRYDFEIQGEDELWGEKAVIIQARPKPVEGGSIVPSGRMWVAERDGAILKIEWDQSTIGHASALAERTEKSKGEPRLTMTSEFGFVQKGIRFPSRHSITEAFARENNKPVERAHLVVAYGQYQFFTVETQVDFTKSPD